VRPRASRRAKISALGTYVPPRVLSNRDLEKMVDTSDEWIFSRVGIRERHLVDKGVATSDMAVEAARKCLDERGIPATELEVIIVATVTPDMFFPATACLVQDRLGASGAWGFDLSAACSGFVYALQVGAKLVESGVHSKVMVIGADTMSSIIDYTDRATCVLFGDGAGAVLIEPAHEGEIGMIDFEHEIDGSGAPALNMPGGGSLNPSTCGKCTTSIKTDRRFTSSLSARWSKPRRQSSIAMVSPSLTSAASFLIRQTSASLRQAPNASACQRNGSLSTSTASATLPLEPYRWRCKQRVKREDSTKAISS
jgi:3-oxoacyl-[acyl-carrier-protein] synthase III